jgi:hypothetical protein
MDLKINIIQKKQKIKCANQNKKQKDKFYEECINYNVDNVDNDNVFILR